MKKKILSFILAFCLILPVSLMFTACGKCDHANAEIKYVVEKDGSTNKAYETKECDDCKKTIKSELENYIVVNTSSAQNTLDGKSGDINGKTIVFAEGKYTSLIIRPTRTAINKAYLYNYSNPLDMSQEVDTEVACEHYNTNVYHYVRNLENVTFVGAEGAEITGVFSIQSKDYEKNVWNADYLTGVEIANRPECSPITYNDVQDQNDDGNIDEGDYAWLDHVNVKNVTFKNLNFTTKRGRLLVLNQYANNFENVTIDNCSFEAEEAWENELDGNTFQSSAIHIDVKENTDVVRKNITVKNCLIDGHFQGVRIANVENVTILNNTIKNVDNSAVNLHGNFSKGEVVIDSNKIEKTGDVAIRFNKLANANVLLENNTMTEAVDSNGKYLKTEICEAGSTLNTKNNMLDGVKLEDQTILTAETNQIILSKPKAN